MQTSSQPIQAKPSQVPLTQMKLSRAGELAKTGDYEAALVLLLQMEPTAAALDMRARIELQRGHYRDARSLWNEVLELAPAHPGAKQGLRSVQMAVTRGKLLRQLTLGVVVLGAASGLYLALRPSAEPPPAKAHVQAAPSLPPKAAAVRSPVPPPKAAIAAAPAKPTLPQLALPDGVSVHDEDGARVYSFEGGLFSEGVTFVTDGRERVTALGRALAPYTQTIRIELVGYVDTLPVPTERQYRDNTELALVRANAVLGRLARTTKIPAEALGLRAVGGRLGPASDKQGDPRNRTVEIRVSLR